MSMIDWGKRVSQGRAKAPGVSWSDKEAEAVALFAQTFNKTMAEVAPYVRKGILTVKAYKEAQKKKGVVNPYLEFSKEVLIKKAQALGLSVSPDATKEVLAQTILEEKQKQAEKAKAEKEEKAKAEAEAKAKKEAEKKAEAEAKAKEKADKQIKNQKEAEKSEVKPNVADGVSAATAEKTKK